MTISEAQFQAQVRQLATLCGWLFYHTHNSQRSDAGFPDCVLVRNGVIVFAELKSERGKLSKAQIVWQQMLTTVSKLTPCVQYYVWRPSDFDEVARVLR